MKKIGISFILCLLLVSCKSTTYVDFLFELKGEDEITIRQYDTYEDAGYTLIIDNEEVTAVQDGEVNTFVPGRYSIKYNIKHEHVDYQIKRVIWVLDVLEEYFSQVAPSTLPEIFASDFISTEEYSEFAGTFSPDYKYFFYTRRDADNENRIFYSQFIDGSWTTPSMHEISEDITEMEPYISPDGKMLYFSSKRDNHPNTAIFVSQFVDGEWQEPTYVQTGLNSFFSMYVSISYSGNLYYTSMDSKIYMMKYVDGYYTSLEYTGVRGAHSYIAPDESFMLIDDSGLADGHTSLYIVRNIDGEWGEPVKLNEEINVPNYSQFSPSISPDGKFIFFTRYQLGKSDIYWVSSTVLLGYLEE